MLTRIATVMTLVVWAASCGGDSSVDGSKGIDQLNGVEKENFCDWLAAKAGGYGTPSSCGAAVFEAPLSQSACLADFPRCELVLVRQFQACVEAFLAAQTTCTPQSLEIAGYDENCQILRGFRCLD